MQEINVDFGLGSPKILCVTAPVQAFELICPTRHPMRLLSSQQERSRRTSSGRLLLEHALQQWGVDTSLLEVRRNEFRAPSVAYLP